jgi:hypothetical protein
MVKTKSRAKRGILLDAAWLNAGKMRPEYGFPPDSG